MHTFYFTYGSNDSTHPFVGGWTEVEANTCEDAIALFDIVHPRITEYVNCAMIYSKGNFGYKCVEKLAYKQDILVRNALNMTK